MQRISLSSSRQFQEKHRDIVVSIKSIFQRTKFAKVCPVAAAIGLIDSIASLANEVGVLNQLKGLINSKEDYTFRHSANVAVVAGLLGKWLGLEESVRRDLMLAGLLHDIGKMQIPLEVLNKPGDLTTLEMNTMKQHPVLGYQLLQSYEEIPKLVKLWILQHHERLDGSGYPYAFQGSKVSYHGQIIAVADIYDAMTSNRMYRDADTPFTVIQELSAEMFGKLDPRICTVFLENLNESLIGNSVKLNNGTEAKIVYMDTRLGIKPVIKTKEGDWIDLEKAKDIRIIEVH